MQAYGWKNAIGDVVQKHPAAILMSVVDGAVAYLGIKFTVIKAHEAYSAVGARDWKKTAQAGSLALCTAAATVAYAVWRWRTTYQRVVDDIGEHSWRPAAEPEFRYTAETKYGPNESRTYVEDFDHVKYPRDKVEVKGYPGKSYTLLYDLTCEEYRACSPELGPDVHRPLANCAAAVDRNACEAVLHHATELCKLDPEIVCKDKHPSPECKDQIWEAQQGHGCESWKGENAPIRLREFVKQKYCNWWNQCDYSAPIAVKRSDGEKLSSQARSPHYLGYQEDF